MAFLGAWWYLEEGLWYGFLQVENTFSPPDGAEQQTKRQLQLLT